MNEIGSGIVVGSMYTKFFRYHVLEKNYPAWLQLSRASNALYKTFKDVSFQQAPTRRIGGDMIIEEIVIYPSKEVCEEIEAQLSKDPTAQELSDAFLEIVHGTVQVEERGT